MTPKTISPDNYRSTMSKARASGLLLHWAVVRLLQDRSLAPLVGSCLSILGVLACSSRDTPDGSISKAEQRLTQTELESVLSFEGTLGTSGDWVKTGGIVASSTAHASAGIRSMVMSGTPSISVTSRALSALGGVGAKLTMDIWLPSALAGQSNKGNLQAFFDAPSLQVYSYATGNVPLGALTTGQFSRVEIPLDSTLRTKLSQSGYADLRIKFTFNLANWTQPTFVDNVVFSSGSIGAGGSTSTGGASALGGAGGFSSSGGAPASGGASSTGFVVSTGGNLTLGGSNSNGGTNSPGDGGAPTDGGAPGDGGASGAGGTLIFSGGASDFGGATSATWTGNGGVSAPGSTASGGSSIMSSASTAGSISTGGTSPTGGSSATGGGSVWTGGTAYTFSLQLPAGVSRSEVVFATTEGELNIEDGVNAYSGLGFASVSAANEGKVNRIGVASHVQSVWSDGDVTLANNAVVHGSLWTAGELSFQAGAQVLGDVMEFADLTPFQVVSWIVNFPPNAQPPVSVSGTQALSPGGYPEYGVKTGGQLNLSSGTYTFNAMMVEPGAILNIDNRGGPVFIYLRDGFTFRGGVVLAAAKANVLFGSAGVSPVVIDSAFTGIVVAPETSITLATVGTEHKGAFFAQSIIARRNTRIVLDGLDSANFCAPEDPCSSFCPCTAGATKTCADNSTCQAGSVCGSGNGAAFGLPSGTNVCWAASCQVTGGIGSQCSRFAQWCQRDADCAPGEVCGQANSAQFLYVANRVCWPAQCETNPLEAGCGTLQMPCGFCPTSCTASCTSKRCGDSPDDGCGGVCTGYCDDGDAGCTSDLQCRSGSICSANGASYYGKPSDQAVCWPLSCERQRPSERDCGQVTSVCGTQCPSIAQQCADRQCGVDPATGASCGTCSAGQFCNNGGQCQSHSTDAIVPAPRGPGSGGTGEATTVPNATDVGAIAGTLTVTQHGRAHYSIPLFVPPGVNGLTPHLSLEYESTLQDGALGVGWSIGGLSTIARCPKSFAQGGPSQILYDDTDQYCLDTVPLVRVSAEPGDGAEYRTEYDSMLRVIARGPTSGSSTGPDHFDVHSPDGRVSRYGGKGQYSVWSATGTYGDWSDNRVNTSWALTHVEDQQGNTIEYLYSPETAYTWAGETQTLPGQPGASMSATKGSRPVLYEIDYGGRSTSAGNRKIVLAREHLWDDSSREGAQRFGWYSGVPFQAKERVSRITMFYEDTEIRSYLLQYDTDARRSKLSAVHECANQRCKQPILFTYKEPQALTLASPTTIDFGGQGLAAIQATFDADGNGLTDFLLNPFLDPDNPANCNGWLFAKGMGSRSRPYEVTEFPAPKPGFDNSCQSVVSTVDLDSDGREEVYGSFQKGHAGGDMMSWTTEVEYDPATNTWGAPVQSNAYFHSYKADLDGNGFVDDGTNPALPPWVPKSFGLDTDSDGVPNEVVTAFTYNSLNYPKKTNAYLNVARSGVPPEPLGVRVPSVTASQVQQDAFLRAHMGSTPASCYPPCMISHPEDPNEWERCWADASLVPLAPEVLKCLQREEQFAGYATGIKFLDANGDGLKDILTWGVGVSDLSRPAGSVLPDSTATCPEIITMVTGKDPVPVYIGPSPFLTLWVNTGRNEFVSGYSGMLLSDSDKQSLNSFLNAGSFRQSFAYDVNQDGLEDIVLVNPTSRQIYALVMVPNAGAGSKFRGQLLADASAGPDWFGATGQVRVLDVDGDGASVIVFGDGKKVAVA